MTFTVPETYAPTILSRRAKKMRKDSGDEKFVTEQDLDLRPFSERLRVFLVRPFQLLFLEPIVLFISLYMSVLYGLLYMFFVAYPIVYQEGKGYSASKTGLMFIPIAVGLAVRCLRPASQQTLPHSRRKTQRQATSRSPPDPHDAKLLVHSHRALHLRLDFLPRALMGGTRSRRLARRFWIHFPVQQRQQLPRRQLPAPRGVSSRRKNLHPLLLGSVRGAVHDADVPQAWVPVGEFAAGFYRFGLLRNSFCLLLQGRSY
jgi:hypothetical protein